jgi:hypothetical protein
VMMESSSEDMILCIFRIYSTENVIEIPGINCIPFMIFHYLKHFFSLYIFFKLGPPQKWDK